MQGLKNAVEIPEYLMEDLEDLAEWCGSSPLAMLEKWISDLKESKGDLEG